ncbi:hypothetical protein F2B00_03170 [Streptomyces parvus]|uniref:hypothetical protein n=1 Tax=Streptomyces parvus TaxID=66428 RepID=UPI00123A2B7D|nr:hypothetical protein [Streptomyces parvus]KAA6203633.1 hypothetical protein F2B00_03170 [Streptomyces parvus]GGS41192.1 hypothetical protein GCM10010221_44960 [Streptomyces parvus]
MTVNHRAEAEKHLDTAARHLTEHPGDMRIAEVAAAIGQGHAALAHREETTATAADMNEALLSLRRRFNDTLNLVSTHIAQGLASRQGERWNAARNLSKALDEAHCNVDQLVDSWLEENGWDPRSAYKTPASLTPHAEPWASKPDITADVPEPVRRVLAGHLAEMLLDPKADDVQKWARGITFELKREGFDLGDAIKKRITDLTLGSDPSDPPF